MAIKIKTAGLRAGGQLPRPPSSWSACYVGTMNVCKLNVCPKFSQLSIINCPIFIAPVMNQGFTVSYGNWHKVWQVVHIDPDEAKREFYPLGRLALANRGT